MFNKPFAGLSQELLITTILTKRDIAPAFADISGKVLWLDASDRDTITVQYKTETQTVSGTSGTTVITASADVSTDVYAGMTIRVNSADEYTVASVSTTTINTVETLSSTYSADTLETQKLVSQWDDESGNSNNAAQGTEAGQPLTGVDTINGLNVITQSSTQGLPIANSDSLNNVFDGGATVFIFCKPTNYGGNDRVFDFSSTTFFNTGNDRIEIFQNTSGTRAEYRTSDAISDNVNILLRISYDTDNINVAPDIYKNGVDMVVTQTQAGTGTRNDNTANDLVFFNSEALNRGADVQIGEIIVYNRFLTPEEITIVEAYLNNKWGL